MELRGKPRGDIYPENMYQTVKNVIKSQFKDALATPKIGGSSNAAEAFIRNNKKRDKMEQFIEHRKQKGRPRSAQ